MSYRLTTLLLTLAIVLWGTLIYARGELHVEDSVPPPEPDWCNMEHSVGRVVVPVTNDGVFGYARRVWGRQPLDCLSGEWLTGFCEYPKGSNKKYFGGGALLVGAILSQDTIVVRWFEPPAEPNGKMTFRSTVDPTKPWFKDAVSHKDIIAKYYDTAATDYYNPTMIEVTQTSYSWANDYGQDIVFFNYVIKNTGTERLRYVYVGVSGDPAVYYNDMFYPGPRGGDDMIGFIEKYPSIYLPDNCPEDSFLVNVAWGADDDGNPTDPDPRGHVKNIVGVRIIDIPDDSARISFNWDTYYGGGFGPQLRKNYRPMENGLGTPWTGEELYHIMRNGEQDYDQAFQAIQHSYDEVWVQPSTEVLEELREGFDASFMLTFGPHGMDPGQSIEFTTAYLAGLSFHRHRHIDEFLPDDPYGWYRRVYFENLIKNCAWADWIYDNPGVDSDSDGYAGEFVICDLDEDSLLFCDTLIDTSANPDTNYVRCRWLDNIADTIWIKGDGIPDFRGAAPPPNPNTHKFVNKYGDTLPGLRVYPEVGRVRMVWNGAVTENTPDWFSHKYDFEGYRVYIALDNRPSSFSLVDSYDKENFNQWEYDYAARKFRCPNRPFTLQELRCMHGDSCGDTVWSPYWYTRTNPLVYPGGPKKNDRIIYFEECGYNRSIMPGDPGTANTDIRKVYPYAVKPPHVHPDSLAIYYPDRDDTTYFDAKGYLKYYEYEYTFEGILPTIPYYVNVTAFDYGYPELGLEGLEGDPAHVPKAMYPLPSSDYIKEKDLGVFVFPNPYRIDADYRARDYEARLRWHIPEDKTRLIHFANLPPKCTISIFSLDGDLIRELEHDVDPDNYLANHETWDLINRNFQLVVTGLYYWVVEDDQGGSQIGKLVIIM